MATHSNPDDLDLDVTMRGFTPGQEVFKRYKLKEVVGRGGMGVVWLAQDEKLGREVALKFLPDIVIHDRMAMEDLKSETNRSLNLTHPNIVRVHDFVEDEARQLACIAMEYVDGDNLSNLRALREHRCFELEELRETVRQLCDALGYAHERAKIVHRDLKPANLMVNSAGELKVTDFGIARSLVDSVSRVSMAAGGTSGTLVYMSPQQALGKAATVQDDIYALGATLYDLLTGRPPFYTGNIYEQVKGVIPTGVNERREEFGVPGGPVPPEWEETIAACLAKDPAERPQSVWEVAERLGLHTSALRVQREVVKATPPVAVVKDAPVARGNRAMLAVVLVVLLLCGGAAGWWFGIEAPARAQREKLVEAKASAEEKQREAEEARVSEESQKAKEAARLAEERIAAREKEKADAEEKAAKLLVNASKEKPFINSLGMKFVPAGTAGVLFCQTDTTRGKWREFIQATGRDMSGGMFVLRVDADGKTFVWQEDAAASWENPGFEQTDEHPVVGVSWEDAKAFCAWLSKKEGREYRLPSDAEWSAAVGGGKYPWGESWPPPKGAGNYGSSLSVDEYENTSPVGSFGANLYGLYDMGGNVWQWCQDEYKATMSDEEALEKNPSLKTEKASDGTPFRVLRGASWSGHVSLVLRSSYRSKDLPGIRFDYRGFRVVLVVSGAALATVAPEILMTAPVPQVQSVQDLTATKEKADAEEVATTLTSNATKEKLPLKVTPGEKTTGEGDLAFGEIRVSRKTVYVGEDVPVDILYFLDRSARWNATKAPTLDGDGFTTRRVVEGGQKEAELAGKKYARVLLRTVATPTKAGRFSLGPAKMHFVYSKQQNTRYSPGGVGTFGPEQEVVVSAPAVELEVKPLPVNGRPKDFDGAVGKFQLTATGRPDRVKAGDPVTMTVIITGQGNFDRIKAPALDEPTGWRTYPATDKFDTNAFSSLTGGWKTFEIAVVPEEEKTETPVFTFSYFDPDEAKYVTLKSDPTPLAKAKEYYEKAAAQGDAYAQTNLGIMYNNGEGVTKDLAKAKEYYEKAAAQGDAYAQNSLGFMYLKGDGVAKDLVKAKEYFRRAMEAGSEAGRKNYEMLNK
jgi:hypothetical protein